MYMRREPSKGCGFDESVKICFPYFWQKCEKCGMEVRQEKMYKMSVKYNFYVDTYKKTFYGCSQCFGNDHEFYKFIAEKEGW